MTELRGAMARSAAWSTGLRLTERALGLVNTVVLARLLTPEDFGVVAMCMVIVAAVEALSAFGFDVVLIQRQDAQRAHYDTAFTLSLLVGVLIGTLLALSGPLIAWF